ncbi:MAG: hypothetical protein ABR981_04005 [Candidatus Micrarchaeaceae archaeon]|jgi:hypothetical protein
MLSENTTKIIKEGSIRIKVKRTSMLQFLVFKIKKVPFGKDDYYTELFVDRVLDMSELQRVANETGLPVEAENGKAFPEGTGAKDFMNL